MAQVKYTEPSDYIPKEIRKKLKLGEYAEDEKETEAKKEERDANDKIRNYVQRK